MLPANLCSILLRECRQHNNVRKKTFELTLSSSSYYYDDKLLLLDYIKTRFPRIGDPSLPSFLVLETSPSIQAYFPDQRTLLAQKSKILYSKCLVKLYEGSGDYVRGWSPSQGRVRGQIYDLSMVIALFQLYMERLSKVADGELATTAAQGFAVGFTEHLRALDKAIEWCDNVVREKVIRSVMVSPPCCLISVCRADCHLIRFHPKLPSGLGHRRQTPFKLIECG